MMMIMMMMLMMLVKWRKSGKIVNGGCDHCATVFIGSSFLLSFFSVLLR